MPKHGPNKKPFSEETRKRMSEAAKRRFADPAAREEHRRIQKELWATEKYQAIIAAQKAAWTPERRERARQAALAVLGD